MADERTLTELANRGELRALEDRWLTIIENDRADRDEMLAALEAVTKRGQGTQAAALGWMWLAARKGEDTPADLLALGRDLIIRCGDSEEMRTEIAGLYRDVFSDRPAIETLIDASGLAGAKSPRRALRTLEICLCLKIGDYLVNRSDEHVAEVKAIDPTAWEYTLNNTQGEKSLDADALALAYDPVDPNDFRVLSQAKPDQLGTIIDSDPVTLIIGVLKSHRGRIDSDHLEHLLSPRLIPAGKWGTWWSKAKTALRRCPHVVIEGRNPIIMTYHAEGQTLEEEIEPQWAKAETANQRLAVIDTYVRETKARKVTAKPAMIEQLYRELSQRVEVSRKGSPVDALAESLLIDRLAQGVSLPAKARSRTNEILESATDLVSLLAELNETRLYVQALDQLRTLWPDRWVEIYLQLLPSAPLEACEPIARALVEAGRTTDIVNLATQWLADPGAYINAVCWLWRGPSIAELEPVPRRELLPKLLEHLADLTRADEVSAHVVRNARARIRAALSADDYRCFREIIEHMAPGMASTIYRTVDRLEGLGHVARGAMMLIIRDTHPLLFVRTRVDPWLDESIIFCTQQGMSKREAELNHLVNVKMPENARAIGEAAAHGDLSENSEYKFALEERDLLRARVLRIQDELSRARLLTANDVSTDEVNIGTKVVLTAVNEERQLRFSILGPWEADSEQAVYNYQAPMCKKLKGLKVGDVVELELDSAMQPYRIEAIANAIEDRPPIS